MPGPESQGTRQLGEAKLLPGQHLEYLYPMRIGKGVDQARYLLRWELRNGAASMIGEESPRRRELGETGLRLDVVPEHEIVRNGEEDLDVVEHLDGLTGALVVLARGTIACQLAFVILKYHQGSRYVLSIERGLGLVPHGPHVTHAILLMRALRTFLYLLDARVEERTRVVAEDCLDLF